jgi:hypothetical protein
MENKDNDLPKGKLVLSLDFDGVIHSYSSGWQGARVIPDPPVPGALEFIVKATEHFDVQIFSSRSHQFGGRRAMKRWLKQQYFKISGIKEDDIWYIPEVRKEIPEFWFQFIAQTAFADPWSIEVNYAVKRLMRMISFPRHKPPVFLSIDDRGYQFNGVWPNPEQLLGFRPWNKRKGC